MPHIRSFNRIFVSSLMLMALLMASATVKAATATLDSLVAGGTLTEGDVFFDGFDFADNSFFPEDTVVSASEITLSTSATASSVSLMATMNPAVAASGALGFFEFFMDFNLSILAPSSRKLSSIDLGGGNLSASGDAFTSVLFAPGTFTGSTNRIEIYNDTALPEVTTDSIALAPLVMAMMFESSITGGTFDASSATGLSTFSLTFNLVDDPPSVVPVPAAVWLFGSALIGMIGFGKRRKKS